MVAGYGESQSRLERRSGASLLELTLALAAMIIVLGGATALLLSASESSEETTAALTGLRADVDVMESLRHDLGRAKLEGVAADGTSLTFSLPIDDASSGSVLDENGSIVWGIADSHGTRMDGTCTLSFLFERTVSETGLGRDLNGDGDTDDAFDEGRLIKTSDQDERLALPRLTVYLRRPARDGDVDGDGTDDPLFQVEDTRVRIRIATLSGTNGTLRVTESRVHAMENDI